MTIFGYTFIRKSYIANLLEQIAYYRNEAGGFRSAYENEQQIIANLKAQLDEAVKANRNYNSQLAELLRKYMKANKTARHLELVVEALKLKLKNGKF